MSDYLTGLRWYRLLTSNWRALARAAELIGRQQRIHRTGTETFQIKGDELESKLLEDGCELRGHGRVQSPLQFLPVDFNPDNIAVMSYSELPEAKRANSVLTPFDHVERLARDGPSVFDPRRKACRRGFIPHAQPRFTSHLPDVLLGQSSA